MKFKLLNIMKNLKSNNNKDKNNHKNQYNNYPKNLKRWCEFRDKAQPIWNLSFKYDSEIKENYTLFINNNLEKQYFNKLFINCNKYIELLPRLRQLQEEENKINNTDYSSKYCIAYHKLALAYEKLGEYENAIKICEEAIENGFEDDKTKSGFKGRIEKIKKKMNSK